jgi:PKD repeat protein
VATFTDADPQGDPADALATIQWGDGTISAGTIQADPAGGFDVLGSHTYKEEGTYKVSVTARDLGGSSLVVASTQFRVADAPLKPLGGPTSFVATVNVPTGNLVVATFADADPGGTVTDDTATIDWGDRSPAVSGLVATMGGDRFFVLGGHTYKSPGTYTVTVTIMDSGGSKLVDSNTTVKVAAASTPAAEATIAAIPGTPSIALAMGALSDTSSAPMESAASVERPDGKVLGRRTRSTAVDSSGGAEDQNGDG